MWAFHLSKFSFRPSRLLWDEICMFCFKSFCSFLMGKKKIWNYEFLSEVVKRLWKAAWTKNLKNIKFKSLSCTSGCTHVVEECYLYSLNAPTAPSIFSRRTVFQRTCIYAYRVIWSQSTSSKRSALFWKIWEFNIILVKWHELIQKTGFYTFYLSCGKVACYLDRVRSNFIFFFLFHTSFSPV